MLAARPMPHKGGVRHSPGPARAEIAQADLGFSEKNGLAVGQRDEKLRVLDRSPALLRHAGNAVVLQLIALPYMQDKHINISEL
ncbi:major facilitator superfamily MFS_1 [Methylocaldum marinum]|uniref:Major facilitator superfamily MFS_1 n=2 Tax=Methylocaldum marinum TaxID=1432792 RepID=A0A250KTZ5_9GAMM|nr:major facilitator superfamily MFS_1 [Methylocaldum marinum]